ncbi:MAG TPA: hypothetical protein VF787_10880 [Thermoanaerobaculia bacterium]
MRRLLLLAVLVFGAFSMLADDECRACDVISDASTGITTAACNLTVPDQMGTTQCHVSYITLPNSIVARCTPGGNACMYIEVNG